MKKLYQLFSGVFVFFLMMIMACGLFEYNVHANTGDHYISVYPKGYNY